MTQKYTTQGLNSGQIVKLLEVGLGENPGRHYKLSQGELMQVSQEEFELAHEIRNSKKYQEIFRGKQ